MVDFKGLDFRQDTRNYAAISAGRISMHSSSFSTPVSVTVDYAAFSISGARQLVCDITDSASNVIDRIYAGATVSALGHRYFSFGLGHQNMTAFVAVAASGDSAGYLSTCLPELRVPPGGNVKVYDISSITNSDTVSFTVSYYGQNIQSYM